MTDFNTIFLFLFCVGGFYIIQIQLRKEYNKKIIQSWYSSNKKIYDIIGSQHNLFQEEMFKRQLSIAAAYKKYENRYKYKKEFIKMLADRAGNKLKVLEYTSLSISEYNEKQSSFDEYNSYLLDLDNKKLIAEQDIQSVEDFPENFIHVFVYDNYIMAASSTVYEKERDNENK